MISIFFPLQSAGLQILLPSYLRYAKYTLFDFNITYPGKIIFHKHKSSAVLIHYLDIIFCLSKTLACCVDKFKSWRRSLRYPCVNKWVSCRNRLRQVSDRSQHCPPLCCSSFSPESEFTSLKSDFPKAWYRQFFAVWFSSHYRQQIWVFCCVFGFGGDIFYVC